MVSPFRCKIGVVLKLYTFFYKRRSKRCILGVNARDMLGLEGLALEVNFQRPWPLPQVELGRGQGL